MNEQITDHHRGADHELEMPPTVVELPGGRLRSEVPLTVTFSRASDGARVVRFCGPGTENRDVANIWINSRPYHLGSVIVIQSIHDKLWRYDHQGYNLRKPDHSGDVPPGAYRKLREWCQFTADRLARAHPHSFKQHGYRGRDYAVDSLITQVEQFKNDARILEAFAGLGDQLDTGNAFVDWDDDPGLGDVSWEVPSSRGVHDQAITAQRPALAVATIKASETGTVIGYLVDHTTRRHMTSRPDAFTGGLALPINLARIR